MTTKKILLVTATITLLMAGCAQKKNLHTPVTELESNNNVSTTTEGYEDNTGHYDNVDPYGTGNYGENNSGKYANENSYSNENSYGNGNSGVKNVYFGVDQYTINSEKLSTIAHNANLLRKKSIKIEGHCDASGSDEYNYALGLRRAKAAKDAMVSNGVSANNISLMSMGESSPECTSSSSAECYAKNRRAAFKVSQ